MPAVTTTEKTLSRHQFLRGLHRVLEPRTYLETGVSRGYSMRISRVPSIGVDPDFQIAAEIITDVHLARTSSDEFFARPAPLAHLPQPVIDLAFVDGMHLAEYALRDYIAVERFTEPASVVVFDDMLPRTVDEGARHRCTFAWTGDVYKAAQALRELRPDLLVFDIDTQPTGVVVVLAPDAGRDGVLPGYDEWVEGAVTPDPQPVPERVLRRTHALDAAALLDHPGWAVLRTLRGRSDEAARRQVRDAFADVTER